LMAAKSNSSSSQGKYWDTIRSKTA
jgi:hypothetical protein